MVMAVIAASIYTVFPAAVIPTQQYAVAAGLP